MWRDVLTSIPFDKLSHFVSRSADQKAGIHMGGLPAKFQKEL
jgi:hypothetical protein